MNSKEKRKFKYPPDIVISESPLLEAWLEIQWKLSDSGAQDFKMDPHYPFALGIFYSQVKNEFEYRQELPASKAPEFMLPHVPQHQFRPQKGGWPILQLGPGVATVNFTKPYTWNAFKEKALYLREKLLEAYKEGNFESQAIILRYRNSYPFNYSTNNVLDFLSKKFNISLSLPENIPSYVSAKPAPSSSIIRLRYEIEKPHGVGQIQIGTALRNVMDDTDTTASKEEILLWEIEVASIEENAIDIKNVDSYIEWLEASHAILHEWFFSIIEGDLFNEFSKGK